MVAHLADGEVHRQRLRRRRAGGHRERSIAALGHPAAGSHAHQRPHRRRRGRGRPRRVVVVDVHHIVRPVPRVPVGEALVDSDAHLHPPSGLVDVVVDGRHRERRAAAGGDDHLLDAGLDAVIAAIVAALEHPHRDRQHHRRRRARPQREHRRAALGHRRGAQPSRPDPPIDVHRRHRVDVLADPQRERTDAPVVVPRRHLDHVVARRQRLAEPPQRRAQLFGRPQIMPTEQIHLRLLRHGLEAGPHRRLTIQREREELRISGGRVVRFASGRPSALHAAPARQFLHAAVVDLRRRTHRRHRAGRQHQRQRHRERPPHDRPAIEAGACSTSDSEHIGHSTEALSGQHPSIAQR